MKFKFIKNIPGRVKTYEGKTVAYGEEIEFSGHFAQKALANPDYKAVQPERSTSQPRSKKKVSRKKVARKVSTHG